MSNLLKIYENEHEGVLLGDKQEILQDLLAVIESTQEKNVRLTKAGIPPKPLWSAINERVLWCDPKRILCDWDECDQVRFLYSLADQLSLITINSDRNLIIGPGADLFFTALPTRRADMLMQAYIEFEEWDERCDARNMHGHRLNFGQTFRRDFLQNVSELRRALLNALARTPKNEWVEANVLAFAISRATPDILISEGDDSPDLEDDEFDPEINRLVDYWLMLCTRFGWVDLARGLEKTLGTPAVRLYRITTLGYNLLHGSAGFRDAQEQKELSKRKPFMVQPNLEVVVYRDEADMADEYLLRRVADPEHFPGWDDRVVTYSVTPESVLNSTNAGLDPEHAFQHFIDLSKTELPSTFAVLFSDIIRKRNRVKLTQGLTAVELQNQSPEILASLDNAGFLSFDNLYLISWDRWREFISLLEEEPREGFRYPSPMPLAKMAGSKLKLMWPVLPLVSRDLLELLEFTGNPLATALNEEKIAMIKQAGWTEQDILLAIQGLTNGTIPKRLTALL